jgi:hypothetical protein
LDEQPLVAHLAAGFSEEAENVLLRQEVMVFDIKQVEGEKAHSTRTPLRWPPLHPSFG